MDTSSPTENPPPSLAAELRESLLLLGFALGVTLGLTTVAQAALTALA
jgi:hypothetical protein